MKIQMPSFSLDQMNLRFFHCSISYLVWELGVLYIYYIFIQAVVHFMCQKVKEIIAEDDFQQTLLELVIQDEAPYTESTELMIQMLTETLKLAMREKFQVAE